MAGELKLGFIVPFAGLMLNPTFGIAEKVPPVAPEMFTFCNDVLLLQYVVELYEIVAVVGSTILML